MKCQGEGCTKESVNKQRFCKDCKKAELKRLQEAGYLTAKLYGGSNRGGDSRENTRETKYGVDR